MPLPLLLEKQYSIVMRNGAGAPKRLSAALRAAFGGCALHAPAGAALCKGLAIVAALRLTVA